MQLEKELASSANNVAHNSEGTLQSQPQLVLGPGVHLFQGKGQLFEAEVREGLLVDLDLFDERETLQVEEPFGPLAQDLESVFHAFEEAFLVFRGI